MEQYSGRVIGGKHAGEYHTINAPYLKLPLPLEINDKIGPAEMPTEPILNTVAIYKHCSMYFRNYNTSQEWKFNFWVPYEIESPQPYIIENLLESYVKC